VAFDPLYGNYGYQVDPDLLRRAQQGSGFGASMDAALKSMTPSAPTYSAAYGVGATPAPSLAPAPALPLAPPVAPAAPAGSKPRLPSRVEVFGLDAPAAPAGSKLADIAQGLAPVSRQAPPGYQPFAADADIARRIDYNAGFGPSNPNRLPGPGQIAGATAYQVPGVFGMGGGPGTAEFQGLPRAPGTGFLGYAGTPETAGMTQQQATAYNVANLNRQTEALRSLNEARQGVSAAGGSAQNLPSPPSFDPFARAGDGFGDSGMRAAQYDSMMKRAADTSIPWRRRQGLAEAAQGMLAPGLAIMGQQGALAQLQAKPSGDPYQLARLTLDQQRFATAQQNQRDRLQYQQQRDAARDRLAMERQQQQQKPHSLDQIKAGMIDRLYAASQASQDTRLNPEERAKWQAELDRMGPFYQQYLGGGGGGF